MAQKKTAARKTFVRKGDVTAVELQAQMSKLKDIITGMENAICGLDAYGIPSVEVDGLGKIDDATRLLTEYVANASQAIDRACLVRKK